MRLRPMRASEVLDVSLRVYQALGWPFLKITAIPSLFGLAAAAFVATYVWPALITTSNPDNVHAQVGELGIAVLLAICVAVPLLVVGLAYSAAAVTHLTSDWMAGHVPSERSARITAMRSMPVLLRVSGRVGLISASGLIIAGGMLGAAALLEPSVDSSSVWLGLIAGFAALALFPAAGGFLVGLTVFALAVPSAVLEGGTAKQACQRSRDLLRSAVPHPSGYDALRMLWGVLLLVFLMVWGGISIAMSVFEPQRWLDALPIGAAGLAVLKQSLDLLPEFAVIWLTVPVWCTTCTLLFYERRIRLEGYDIDALAKEIWRADRQSRFEL